MKRKLFTAALYVFFAFAFLACTREIEPTDYLLSNQWWVSIEATKGDEESKALTLDSSTLSASWTAGDIVTVTKNGTVAGTLTAKSSGSQTVFEGTLEGPFDTSDVLTLSYLSSDYTGQNGTIEYIASHCDCAVAEVSITSTSDRTLVTSPAVFKNQQAITSFVFADGETELHPSKIKISASGGKLVQSRNGSNSTYGPIEVSCDKEGPVIIALSSDYGEKETFSFVATIGDDVYTGKKKVKLENGKYYATSVNLSKFEMSYVELFGIKWATCNLGAYSEEEYGDYYAWGETAPRTVFSWNDYLWCNGSRSNLTKYCSHSDYGDNGFTDNKTTLDYEDDAAHIVLGGHWRMPTYKELKRLDNWCTWTWSTVNGVNGYKVSYLSYGSIFIPAAGNMTSAPYGVGSHGYYWCSDREDNYSYQATDMHICDGTREYHRVDRYSGRSIRPVYDPNLNIPVTSVSLDQSTIAFSSCGEIVKLVATIIPEIATDKELTWTSSNVDVATVSPDGTVMATGPGTATITVTTVDGGKTATCTVTVSPVAVTSVTLNKTNLSLNKGYSETLVATVLPDNATDKTVTWTSSISSIATVDANGKVTAKGAGTATITAKAGDKSATCTVTVIIPVTSIKIYSQRLKKEVSKVYMFPGDTDELSIVCYPTDATNKSQYTTTYWVYDYKYITGVAGLLRVDEDCNISTFNNAVKVVSNGLEAYLTVQVMSPNSSAVDLDLSVYWASSNYGTTPDEPYGRYYAWTPDWSKVTSGWRVPTKAEMQELLTNCTPEHVTENGISGIRFTSVKNKNSIFLPDAGGYLNSTFYPFSQMGACYWSSTKDSSYNETCGYRLIWGTSHSPTLNETGNSDYMFPIRMVKTK